MKIAFISDIHGNATALEAVLEDIQKKMIDKVIVLGDLCFRGPEPQKCIDLVRELKTDVIKGNADEWVVRGVREGEVPQETLEIMNMERKWTVSQLKQESLDYLDSLPLQLTRSYSGVKIQAFHATPDSLFESVLPEENEDILFEKLIKDDGDLFVYGHIHKAYIRYVKGKCIVNSGSVGLPLDGMNSASYCLLETGKMDMQSTIVRVRYDVEKTISKILQMEYPNSQLLIKLLGNGMND